MKLWYDLFETSQGWIGVLASTKGLRRSTVPQPSPDLCYAMLGKEVETAEPSPQRFEALREKLNRYLDGEEVSFEDEPIDVDDAPAFHRAAWEACRGIPAGETRSYQWLAAQAGNARAPRAAGQSMARNRLALIIPCHRVIASDGGLGGYGRGRSGLDLKRRLLQREAGWA